MAELVLEVMHLEGLLSETNRIVSIVVTALLLLFLFDRIKDLRERKDQAVFLVTANLTVDDLDQLRLNGSDRITNLEEVRKCIGKMLDRLLEAFAKRGGLNLNVMLPADSTSPQQLRIWHKTNKDSTNNFEHKSVQGGRGSCFHRA